MDLINNSFRCGGMSCALDQNMLPKFIQRLKREHELPTKKAIYRPGKQDSGVYFLNEEVAIDVDGNLVTSHDDKYVWLKKDLISENDKILVTDIIPCIHLPLSTGVLKELFTQMKVCLKHNLIPALFVVAGAAMSFHYNLIVSLYSGCHIVVATGPSSTGKTTSIKAGLSLFGCSNNNMFVKGTNRGFLERSSMSSIPYGIDDPKLGKSKSKANQLDIAELAVDLFNGSPTANYNTGVLNPLSLPLIATNFDADTEER